MKKKIIAALCLIISFLLLSPLSFSVSAEDSGESAVPKLDNCRAACLYDLTHQKTLVMENADTPLNTSTSAKVMMGLLACEMLSDRLDETVTITDKMISGVGGKSMRLQVGERLKIVDLLYGAICGSLNDAGYAIASLCADSSAEFVALMNKRAKALGALSTNYTNPLGYPDNAEMLTTVSDTLKIAIAASQNELYMEICSAKSHTVPSTDLTAERTVKNQNLLVTSGTTQAYFNPVCRGMNAGSSGDDGGWSIITLAKDDGADYLCIILGGEESEDGSEIYGYSTANALIDWACEKFNLYNVFNKDQILGQADIEMTALGTKKVSYAAAEELSVYIPDSSDPKLTYKTKYTSERLSAPISAGDRIGTVSVFCNGELVGQCDIVLTEDCEANAVMKVINAIGEYTESRAFIATLICFAILLPAVLIIKSRRSHSHGGYGKKY